MFLKAGLYISNALKKKNPSLSQTPKPMSNLLHRHYPNMYNIDNSCLTDRTLQSGRGRDFVVENIMVIFIFIMLSMPMACLHPNP